MKAAVYSGTRNLYADMVPAVKSLLHNSDVERVYLLIEDDEFPFWLPHECVCVNVSFQPWLRGDGPNFSSPWTYMTLMKVAYQNLFKDLDSILSLDVDTVVCEDISELWDIPLDGFYFAGVQETAHREDYINAGVMMVNLKELRDGMGDRLIETLNTRKFLYNEQDCLNELCAGRLLKIDSKYNANDFVEPTRHPKIVHFAGIRKWQNQPLVQMYRDMDWEMVRA